MCPLPEMPLPKGYYLTKFLSTKWPTIQLSWLIRIGKSWVNPLPGKFLLLKPPQKDSVEQKFQDIQIFQIESCGDEDNKQQLQFVWQRAMRKRLDVDDVPERRRGMVGYPSTGAIGEPVGMCMEAIVELTLEVWHRDATRRKKRKLKMWFRCNSSICS